MHKLLIDTSVWLNLAKDHRQTFIVSTLKELILSGQVELIVPRTVYEEFDRNRGRIADEGGKSALAAVKRAKELMERFGSEAGKFAALEELKEVEHRIPTLGETALETLEQLDSLFQETPIIEISDALKLQAAERGIKGLAPFHRSRNGMNDALIIETYAAALARREEGDTFSFVTHNFKDFSHHGTDNRLPHLDLDAYFIESVSTYHIDLVSVLREVDDVLFEHVRTTEWEWTEEPQSLAEILSAIDLLTTQVWYNRHWNSRVKVESGEIDIVEKETFPVTDHEKRPIQRDIWEGALASAARVEEEYGLENLGPWDDFEWGMINGKLSALRWVLGDEWDSLHT